MGSGGSVASQLQVFGPLSVELTFKYTVQLLRGVAYLHNHYPPIVHRDLKCANLLLTQDGDIKIADFGCSKRVGISRCEAGVSGADPCGDASGSIAGSIY